MKLGLAQINTCVSNIAHNLELIKAQLAVAKVKNVDLCIFPELALTGYPPKDSMQREGFFEHLAQALKFLATGHADQWFVLGAPHQVESKVYNAAYVIGEGRIQHIAHKQLLPNYDVFDERRYFTPSEQGTLMFKFKEKNIALLICEDIWEDFVEEKHFKYRKDPLDELQSHDLDLMINISASPYYLKKESIRHQVIQRAVSKLHCDVVYLNLVGGNDELLFDGQSLVMSKTGQIMHSSKKFQSSFDCVDLDVASSVDVSEPISEDEEDLEMALVMGIKDFFNKTHQQHAIIGVSGGIDSALVLVLAYKALGQSNLTPIYMPSQYSSELSLQGAQVLCENLGLSLKELPIDTLRQGFSQGLQPYFKKSQSGVAEENIQARIRGTLLMAYSNKFGGMVLNTSNKSELAVGYSTLYGDLIGGLSVLGDLYKHQVYALSTWMNRDGVIIPDMMIDRPPTAELRADQKDSDSLPEYAVLDAVLKMYIEDLKSESYIVECGYSEETVKKIISLVERNEFKRRQAPPILRVSKKAFGVGRRMNIAVG